MYEVKNRIYLNLTKTQKSALCNFLRALVKKSPELQEEEILEKFIEDENTTLKLTHQGLNFYPK